MNITANVLVRLVWVVCIDFGCLLLAGAVAALTGLCWVGAVPCGCWWGVQYW